MTSLQHTPPSNAQPDPGTITVTREQVTEQVTIWLRGAPRNVRQPIKWSFRPVSAPVAMQIAAWCSPGPALEAFAADGTILPTLAQEIRAEIDENDHRFGHDRRTLEALFAYVTAVGSVDPDTDMRIRLLPTERQMRVAAAILGSEEDTDAVVVALALPGKQFGIWIAGQEIEEVPGFWLAKRDTPGPIDSMRTARDYADDAALAHLGKRPGTTAYVYIRRGGLGTTVFEGIENPVER